MTKDEYLYALASVKMDGDYCDEKKYSILRKLIEEHFDNLPLKFEEKQLSFLTLVKNILKVVLSHMQIQMNQVQILQNLKKIVSIAWR